jgi:hypothetical protein
MADGVSHPTPRGSAMATIPLNQASVGIRPHQCLQKAFGAGYRFRSELLGECFKTLGILGN